MTESPEFYAPRTTPAGISASKAQDHVSTAPLSTSVDCINDMPRNVEPHVIIKPLTGQAKLQLVDSRDITVRELKLLICTSQGIPVEQQRLMHAKKQLGDRQTLRKAGIPLGAVIDLRRVGLRGNTQRSSA